MTISRIIVLGCAVGAESLTLRMEVADVAQREFDDHWCKFPSTMELFDKIVIQKLSPEQVYCELNLCAYLANTDSFPLRGVRRVVVTPIIIVLQLLWYFSNFTDPLRDAMFSGFKAVGRVILAALWLFLINWPMQILALLYVGVYSRWATRGTGRNVGLAAVGA